jgi:hypothetical protein
MAGDANFFTQKRTECRDTVNMRGMSVAEIKLALSVGLK